MRVVVAGSRDLSPSSEEITRAVSESGFLVAELVSGACPTGVDAAGEAWACSRNIPVRRFEAQWSTYGKRAGPMRNAAMAAYCDAAIVVMRERSASHKSRGSENMVQQMRRANKPCFVVLLTHTPTARGAR